MIGGLVGFVLGALLLWEIALLAPPVRRRVEHFLGSFEGRPQAEAQRCYRPYTTDFDAVAATAEDLDRILGPPPARYAAEAAEIWQQFETGLAGFRLRMRTAAAEAAQRLVEAIPVEMRRDIVVTLLIDHSGSMRGPRILHTAAATEIVEEWLLALGIKIEILGHTTVHWKGGRSRRRWLDRGCPANPGRLNDLLHIVYRAADETHPPEPAVYRSMLRLDILKENIDGEALKWAAARLQARPESRKLLITISDGAPVDDSTLSENAADYLIEHLRAVIRRIEFEDEIEAASVGLGDLPYDCSFNFASCARDPEAVGIALLDSLEQLLTCAARGDTAAA